RTLKNHNVPVIMGLDFILYNNGQITINKDYLTLSRNCFQIPIISNFPAETFETKVLDSCKCSNDKDCNCINTENSQDFPEHLENLEGY
ncbi:hypothetical protein, partial [Escherichia coli]|uniref:hypothetical protein n=1 Tax=Escherichia coli TaxID=562 RepID=UPI0032DAD6E9